MRWLRQHPATSAGEPGMQAPSPLALRAALAQARIMNATARKCPVCRKPRSAEHAPFCSARCRDRDLLQWLEGGYSLPGPPAISDPDEER